MRRKQNTNILWLAALLAVLAAPSAAYGGGGLEFKASPSGAQEVPEVDTDGTAEVEADFNEALSAIDVELKVLDTTGVVFTAHFHCAPAGANGPAIVILIGGVLDFDGEKGEGTVTNDDIINPLCGNNIASLAFAMRAGNIYVNIHTDDFPGGEIRGQMLEE